MKRSRGITLLVLFLLSFAAYVLWSAHPFYVEPRLKFEASVPHEAEQVIKKLYAEQELGEAEAFSFASLLYLMAHPYECGVSHYVVSRESRYSYRVRRSNFGASSVTLKDGQWQMVWDTLY
jgi:hypothetical protein